MCSPFLDLRPESIHGQWSSSRRRKTRTQFAAASIEPSIPQIRVCLGGDSRQESSSTASLRLQPAVDLVLIHDAARPLVNRGS